MSRAYNPRCEHYHRESGDPNENEMANDEQINIICQVKNLGVQFIILDGERQLN